MSNSTNSPSQLIAQVLESALLKALKPIVERQDRLEELILNQPPVTRQELNNNPPLEVLSQQVQAQRQDLMNLTKALVALTNGLNPLLDKTEHWHQEQRQSLEILHNMNQRLEGQEREVKELAIAFSSLASNAEQQIKQQNKLSGTVEQLSAVVEKLSDLLLSVENR